MRIIAIFCCFKSLINESLLDDVKESSMSESLFDWARGEEIIKSDEVL